MSFVKDSILGGAALATNKGKSVIDDLTGKSAGDAAQGAAGVQVQAGKDASALFDPFQGIGNMGLNQADFLVNPDKQFNFLQNNPLFQMGLDNANEQTLGLAASRGRLSAGDTLQQLNNNSLLQAQPLIQSQKNSIGDLLNFGLTTAGNQGNLLTGQGAAAAGGIVGEANARGQGAKNIFNTGLQAAGAFSDPALKENKRLVDVVNGFNIYLWDWNTLGNKLGLYGSSTGVMADEVKLIRPDAVTMEQGYMKVNYSMIGV